MEYNSVIGGRVAHTTFGAKDHSYTVELGANWVKIRWQIRGRILNRFTIGSRHIHTWRSGQSDMDVGMLSSGSIF